jgi:ubiquinone/menaquinone biosynthesis C-methylase UbiE
MSTGADVKHPLFARMYPRMQRTAAKRGETEHRRRLLEGLKGRVLEIGAGHGANFPLYPAAVTEVVAVEPEPRLRADAQRVAERAPVPVRVLPGVADDLPLDDDSVDAAVACLVLCTVPDVPAALAEIRRVLRPAGELRFYEHVIANRQPMRGFLKFAEATFWPAVAGGCHPARDTAGAIRAAGFHIERCERFPFSAGPLEPAVPHILGLARPTA